MDVPIIGQPKIGDWSLSFVVTCTCGETFLVTGKAGASVICKCKKAYQNQGFQCLGLDVALQVKLAVGVAP